MDRLNCGLEVKLLDTGADAMTFEGYGAVFNNIDGKGDRILPGAFKNTLNEAKQTGNYPDMLLQHGGITVADNMPIGIWSDMHEDDHGLYVKGVLADTQAGQDVYKLLKMQPRPALRGLSIGFLPKDFEMGRKYGDPRRTLKSINLYEVSLVSHPANRSAVLTNVKDLMHPRDMETGLRDAGLSRADAKTAVAYFQKSLLRDAGAPDMGLRDAGSSEELAAIQRLIQTMQGA